MAVLSDDRASVWDQDIAMRIVPVLENRWQGRSWHAAAALMLPLLAACGATSATPPSEESEAYRVPVVLGQASRRDITVTSSVVGQLAPWRMTTVAPEVAGNVASLEVELGSPVSPGDVLFRLDSTTYDMALASARAQLTRAEAQRINAETNLSRFAGLAREGVATTREEENWQRDLDIARAEVAAAQAQIDLAAENARDCIITAPIGGVVTRRRIEVGEYLAPGTPAVDIADLSRVKLLAEISERERVALRLGQPVAIAVDALGGELISGEIFALGSSATAQTRSFPIEIAIDNREGRLLAGMIATATLVLEQRAGRLVVPAAARVQTLAGEGVFVPSTATGASGTAVFVPVDFGPRHGDIVEVSGGIGEGETVVVRGAESLRDGVALRIDQPASPEAGRASAATPGA